MTIDINAIAQTLMKSLVDSLTPLIDAKVEERIKALPDPLNGSYVTAEEFREYERRLECIEKYGISEGVNEQLKSIERKLADLDSQVQNSVSGDDLDDKISDAFSNHDFSDEIDEAIGRADLSSEIEDAVRDHDFSSDIEDEVTRAIEDLDIPSEGDICEIVNRLLDKRLDTIHPTLMRRIGEALVDTANANEGI